MTRTVLPPLCLVLAMLTAAACAPVNEAVSSRDLDCNTAPDDICIAMADHLVGLWSPSDAKEFGPIVRFKAVPLDCPGARRRNPTMRQCWQVEGGTADGFNGSGGAGLGNAYYQLADGRLFSLAEEVIGTFPVK